MQKFILYGAGDYGKRIHRILRDKVAYFCDSYRTGTVNGVRVIPFHELEEVANEYKVIISVLKPNHLGEISRKLTESGVSFYTVEQAVNCGIIDVQALKHESELDYWMERFAEEDMRFSNEHYKQIMLSIAEEKVMLF